MKHRAVFFRKLLSILLCLPLLLACAPAARATALMSAPLTGGQTQNGMVRVYLSSLGNPSVLNLTVYGSYTVNGKSSASLSSGSKVAVHFNAATGALTLTANGATTAMGTSFKLRRHATSGQNGVKIAQGRVSANLYPGDFQFLVKKNGASYKLYTIAYIYMEDYLYGVLPYEMGNSSGLEALKAQAVAARTYTMRAMSASQNALYDVVDTTSDQVYSGTPSGNANCVAAIDATRGIVAMNGSAFTATYYTASNGGQTESVKNAWNSNACQYLSVKDDPYDLANPASPKRSFSVSASGTQSSAALQSLLNAKAAAAYGGGASVTGVSNITPHTPKYASPSRLYTKMDFTVSYTLGGRSYTGRLTFDIFNELEGPMGMGINKGGNELWSVERTANGFTVFARRYGHGIGMSQRGAMYMAQLGYTYDQILAFYFDGCRRVQYTLNRSILSPIVDGQDSTEEIISVTPAPIDGAKDGSAVTVAETALRSAPFGGETIVTLPRGASVTLCAAAGSDYLVAYGVLCGYVPQSAVTVYGGVPAYTDRTPTQLVGHGTVINSRALNLRSAASMSGSVLTTIPGGTVVPILSLTDSWAYVQYGLRAGYVSTAYLSIRRISASALTPAPTSVPGASGLQARVVTPQGSLNLRETASDAARVLCTIPQNTALSVLERGGTWSKIVYAGRTGYVMTRFLSFLSDAQTPLPTAIPQPTAAPAGPLYAQVVTASGSLNLRATATANGRVLRTIPQYATIPILDRGDVWCKTSYGGYTGYVMTRFLSFASAPTPTAVPTAIAQPTAAPAPDGVQYARVTTVSGSLNLRQAPRANAKVLCTIPQYELIALQERGTVWCKTSYAGQTGYVMSSFLSFLSDQLAPTQAPAPQPTPRPTEAPQTDGSVARVTTDSGSLNLRAAPSESGQVLRTIAMNEAVIVRERGAVWCKITYSGVTGYVMTRFLTFLPGGAPMPTAIPTARPTAVPTAAPGGTLYAQVTTASGSLNLRETPSGSARVLLTIPQYARVPVLSRGSQWCMVSYNEKTGYVMTRFLSFAASPAPTAAPTAVPTAIPGGMNEQLTVLAEPLSGRVMPRSGSSVNLRGACSTAAPVLCQMPKYDYLSITAVGDTWCAVEYDGQVGYCMREFLEFSWYD